MKTLLLFLTFFTLSIAHCQNLEKVISLKNSAKINYDKGNYKLALSEINSAIAELDNYDRDIPQEMMDLKSSINSELEKQRERQEQIYRTEAEEQRKKDEEKAELERKEAAKTKLDLFEDLKSIIGKDSIQIKQLFGYISAPELTLTIDSFCVVRFAMKNGTTKLYGTFKSFFSEVYSISFDEVKEFKYFEQYDINKDANWCVEIIAESNLDKLKKSSHIRQREEGSKEVDAWKSDFGEALASTSNTMITFFLASKEEAQNVISILTRLKEKC